MKRMRLAAALAVAGAAIVGSSASAIIPPRDPACDQRVANECTANYAAWGYPTYADCVRLEQCYQCPPVPGYLCGYDPRYPYYAVTKPDQPE